MRLVSRSLDVALLGNGRVSRALQERLPAHGMGLASVHDSRGLVGSADADHDVVVDCTPPRYTGPAARAWIERLDGLLEKGTPVVTCNKAPVALAGSSLSRHGTPFLISATVGSGTPILPTLRRLAGAGIQRVEGVLNGTLTSVLADVWRGKPLEEAVAHAQDLGLAEPDPRLDLDGTDALAKAVIVQQVVFGRHTLLESLPRLRIEPDEVRAQAGPPNLILDIRPTDVSWRIGVADWAGQAPAAAAVRVTTAHAGVQTLTGPGAGPSETAAALLADLESLDGRGAKTAP